jgi:hypothetical protein
MARHLQESCRERNRKKSHAAQLLARIQTRNKGQLFDSWVEWLRDAVWLRFEERAWQAERRLRQGPSAIPPPTLSFVLKILIEKRNGSNKLHTTLVCI